MTIDFPGAVCYDTRNPVKARGFLFGLDTSLSSRAIIAYVLERNAPGASKAVDLDRGDESNDVPGALRFWHKREPRRGRLVAGPDAVDATDAWRHSMTPYLHSSTKQTDERITGRELSLGLDWIVWRIENTRNADELRRLRIIRRALESMIPTLPLADELDAELIGEMV